MRLCHVARENGNNRSRVPVLCDFNAKYVFQLHGGRGRSYDVADIFIPRNGELNAIPKLVKSERLFINAGENY